MNECSDGFLAYCKDILCISLCKRLWYAWKTSIKEEGECHLQKIYANRPAADFCLAKAGRCRRNASVLADL